MMQEVAVAAIAAPTRKPRHALPLAAPCPNCRRTPIASPWRQVCGLSAGAFHRLLLRLAGETSLSTGLTEVGP